MDSRSRGNDSNDKPPINPHLADKRLSGRMRKKSIVINHGTRQTTGGDLPPAVFEENSTRGSTLRSEGQAKQSVGGVSFEITRGVRGEEDFCI